MNITGQDIRKHRFKKGITQQELADILGVNVATVNKWEAGSHIPSGRRMASLYDWMEENKQDDDAIIARIIAMIRQFPESAKGRAFAAIAEIDEQLVKK